MLDTTLEMHHGQPLRVARLGRGEAVLLLHGYPENLQVFARLAPALALEKQVIALDWPGMGDSADWPGGATPQHLAQRLLALLDDWHIDRVHLIGQDMGGQPALVFAARYPARVRSVVVLNSLVSPAAPTSWEIRWLRRFGANWLLLAYFPRLVFRRALATFLPAGAAPEPALFQEMWRTFRRPGVRQFIIRLCAAYEGQLPRLPAWYRQVACPVLILWGARDKHFPVAQAHHLHALIPHAHLEIIPAATHWMVLAQPTEVAARIRVFHQRLQ